MRLIAILPIADSCGTVSRRVATPARLQKNVDVLTVLDHVQLVVHPEVANAVPSPTRRKLNQATGGTTLSVDTQAFDAHGRAEIRKITTNLNLGEKLEISQGLSEADQVIVNPSDSLANGMAVKILNQKPTSKE